MKNRVLTNILLLLAMVGMMFTSCKKDPIEPPIQDLPIGKVYTIDSILKLESGTIFTEDASVYGIVTADEKSGNLYKTAFIQDRATGAAIELHLNAPSGVTIGDSIRVYLKDVTYTTYYGLPQLDKFEADGHIVILANNKPITPANTTIAEVNQGKFLAGLIRLDNVKFTEKNVFADPSGYGKRTLIDASDPTNNLYVRTSNYANFAYDSLPSPEKTGSLIAIATCYNTEWQLTIRSVKELYFEGYTPGGNPELPYFQDFSNEFGTYTTYSVVGDQEWEIDYNTAKMTGHVGNSNFANEDWLISAPITLNGVDHAKVGVNYAAQYQNSNTEDVTLQVSKDYVAGTDPLTANWIQMPVTYPNTSGWSDFQTVETSLDEFLGEKVTVAIKFLSSETQSRTFEIKFIIVQEGEPGNGPTPPPGGGELQNMPYTQSFATDFGTYMTYDVFGPQSWSIAYSTAKMSGYAGGSNANEDWLISSPVAVTGVSEAKATVVYSAQYQSSNANDVSLQISTDYVFGTDPTAASWTQMLATYPNTSSFNDFQTVETSLNDFIGQNVTVAIRYVSDDSQSRTIEIQSITVQEGSGGGPTPPPGPGTVEGDGSRENPYTANDIILLGIETSDGNKYWVKDYIVGAINPNNNYVYEFTAATSVKTNLIISSNIGASTEDECVPIQLPVGAVRDGLNLPDNPGNYQQEVLLYGTLEKYFQKPSVKNVTYAEINGNSFGTDPGDTPTPGETIFSETFANGQGNFTIQDVNLGGLSYVWKHDSNYSCMKASAYFSSQNHESESWLVSPAINLSGVNAATLKFDQAVNYASPQGTLSVMISTNYNGDVTTATWNTLNLSEWPAGSNWTFINSTADLTSYVGQTVTIAFKYTSTNSASATWEVKNFVVE